MDLRTGDWCEPTRDDYMCVSCGYEYVEPTQEQTDTMNDMLSKVFHYADERKLYLTILSTG